MFRARRARRLRERDGRPPRRNVDTGVFRRTRGIGAVRPAIAVVVDAVVADLRPAGLAVGIDRDVVDGGVDRTVRAIYGTYGTNDGDELVWIDEQPTRREHPDRNGNPQGSEPRARAAHRAPLVRAAGAATVGCKK
jgi:hypothetical protein